MLNVIGYFVFFVECCRFFCTSFCRLMLCSMMSAYAVFFTAFILLRVFFSCVFHDLTLPVNPTILSNCREFYSQIKHRIKPVVERSVPGQQIILDDTLFLGSSNRIKGIYGCFAGPALRAVTNTPGNPYETPKNRGQKRKQLSMPGYNYGSCESEGSAHVITKGEYGCVLTEEVT